MSEQLRLFVDPAWRRSGLHAPLMYPFWGNPNEASSLFAKEMFDTFSFDTRQYTIIHDAQHADMVFAPYRHVWLLQNDPELLATCIVYARTHGLPLLIDGVGDVEYPISYEHAYVLRIGGYRFLPEKNRIQIPPASDDLLMRCRDEKLSVRPKTEGVPSVGFAAWIHYPKLQALRTIAREAPLRVRGVFDDRYRACTKGVFWRKRAVDVLQSSPRVSLNVRARMSFSGTTKTAEKDMRDLREELVRTILDSDYALDVRGDANDATRLYEILSLGRIPVILDTERNFPFSDVVKYRDFAIIVDFREVSRLPEIIADFHARVSAGDYEDMQRKAHEAFVNHFRIDAQTKHIVRYIRENLAKRKK